jgi:hypothetical protein
MSARIEPVPIERRIVQANNRWQKPGLVVRLVGSGVVAPLVAGPTEWKRLVGDPRSAHSIRSDCETGRLPTLPRAGGSGSHHRIAVAKALDQLGVAYEIIPGAL